jgi:hypothetical protein
MVLLTGGLIFLLAAGGDLEAEQPASQPATDCFFM